MASLNLPRLGRANVRGIVKRCYSSIPEAGPSGPTLKGDVPPRPPRRRSRRASLTPEEEASLYRQGGPSDLVGPPDPVSNIRPVIYARLVPRASHTPSSSSSSSSSSAPSPLPSTKSSTHPYSTSEFNSPSSYGSRQKSGILSRWAQDVGERLQEAELQLRLARMSGDGLTQRFWRDNNSRFVKDLDEARERGRLRSVEEVEAPAARIAPGQEAESLTPGSKASEEKALELADAKKKGLESVDSTFYAQWLDANGARHRAYNILVWKQAALEVKLGARVAWLKFLLRTTGH